MIRRMKKLSLFVFHEDKTKTLEMLSSLDIVHIDIKNGVTSTQIESILSKKTLFQKAEKIIDNLLLSYEKNKKELPTEIAIDSTIGIEDIVNETIDQSEELENYKNSREAVLKEISVIKPFGDFSFEKIEALKKDTGYVLSFHVASLKEFNSYDFSKHEDITVEKVREEPSRVYFVAFKKTNIEDTIPFDTVSFQNVSLSALEKDVLSADESIEEAEAKILSLRSYIPYIHKSLSVLDISSLFESASASFEASEVTDGKVLLVTAFVPQDKEGSTKLFLDNNSISYILAEPSKDDDIPVELKNGKYSGAYQMITKLFQLPDYFELDLTPMIAVFYPIFFAFCFGDAGYGLVLTILAIVGLLTKLKGEYVSVGIIALTLGVLTTLMGIVNSGVVFGVNFVDVSYIPLFEQLSKFTFITDRKEGWFFTPFNTALLCGLLQIFVALILNIINRVRFGELADIFGAVGKMLLIPGLVLWFLGDIQNMPAIKNIFYPYYYILIGVGTLFLVVLTNVGRKPDVLNSVLSIYFAATGILGDVLSYIRLFALGASSGILGLVVNQIGGSFASIPYVGIPIMIIFLILGHSGNFALSILGSLVHPLRLTFVEFYNNVGFKGGGKEYRPLKKLI